MTVPTMTAASPPGMPNGRRTPAVQRHRMIANDDEARSSGTSHIWNAGRIEMKAIEMPGQRAEHRRARRVARGSSGR